METDKKKSRQSRDKYDAEHFKYQTVKLKIEEANALEEYSKISGTPKNTIIRQAIMQYLEYFEN